MYYKSVIDKIKIATLETIEESKRYPSKRYNSSRLGVSSFQLIRAVVDLFNIRNIDGMRNLYESYRDYMLTIKSPKTKEEKIRDAQETLDSVCMMADAETCSANDIEMAEIGPIRNFYRSAICYRQN